MNAGINYQSSAKTPFWTPFLSLLSDHRGLIRSMVKRDLSSRYKGSVMGLAWAIITPAVMMAIYTLIFSGVFQAKFGEATGPLDFALYLFCGMLPWMAFSDGVQRSTSSITENMSLVKRVVFPIEALPVNLALASVVQQLLGTVALIVAILLFKRELHLTLLYAPILLIPQLLATVGVGWMMASLGVFIRDMTQFNQLFFSAWMYLTPIFYPEKQIPERFKWLVNLNPMAPLIRSYRRVYLEGLPPDWRGLSVTLAFALVCFVLGYWWFERTKKAFADVL
jgi:lipopolysaccharide transport system permease protein